MSSKEHLLYNTGLYSKTGYATLYPHYQVRRIDASDRERQEQYQKLRAEIFVKKLRWNIPLVDGYERDRYDVPGSPKISVHCIYDISDGLLPKAGVRIFELDRWEDGMTFNEFTCMIPTQALSLVKTRYLVSDILELTRLCVVKGPSSTHIRDYIYAVVYAYAEALHRPFAMAIVDELYFKSMQRANFSITPLHIHFSSPKRTDNFALIMIDLPRTIQTLQETNQQERVWRMMALCPKNSWMYK